VELVQNDVRKKILIIVVGINIRKGEKRMQINKTKFKDIKEIDEHTAFGWLKLSEAKVSPNNIRPNLKKEDIEIIKTTLLPSIKALGLSQLPQCTPEGEIFAGSRRLKAFELGKEPYLPTIIKDADSKLQMALSWAENKARKEVEVFYEAEHLKKMMEGSKMTQENLATFLGVPRTYIVDRLKILEHLSAADINIVSERGLTKEQEKKAITQEKAVILSRDWVPAKTREKLVKKITEEGLGKTELQRELGKGKVIQTIIEQEEKPEIKAKLEKEYGGDKSFEVEPETVLEKQRELKGLAPSLTKIELPAENFETDSEKIDVQIHPKVMQRIVKYFLDKKGRYVACEVKVTGEVAKSEKD
jgi:ParB/RepB/Spo0J family partition protein